MVRFIIKEGRGAILVKLEIKDNSTYAGLILSKNNLAGSRLMQIVIFKSDFSFLPNTPRFKNWYDIKIRHNCPGSPLIIKSHVFSRLNVFIDKIYIHISLIELLLLMSKGVNS